MKYRLLVGALIPLNCIGRMNIRHVLNAEGGGLIEVEF